MKQEKTVPVKYVVLYCTLFAIVGAFLLFLANIYMINHVAYKPLAFYYNDYACFHVDDIGREFDYKATHELCHAYVEDDYEHFCEATPSVMEIGLQDKIKYHLR